MNYKEQMYDLQESILDQKLNDLIAQLELSDKYEQLSMLDNIPEVE